MVEEKNKSPELLTLEEKDRRTNLKKFCNSILQKIGELDNSSGDRAIWELCQNARDQSCDQTEGAIINITLDSYNFIFAHKGKPFDSDSLLSLVKQVSSESKENTDTAGQFGTGFVTTHYLSRKFYLNGSFLTGTGKIFDLDHFEIDRTEDDINKFIDAMDKQIKAVYHLLETPEAPLREWTEIIYPLTDETHKIALKAMRTSEKMLPEVLVLNDNIKTVSLRNLIDNQNIIYTKGKSYLENDLFVQEINKFNDEKLLQTIHVYYLQQDDCKIIIPLENVYKAKSSECIANLFVWFPLLGTEMWGTNFIYHSSFYSLEKRNGIVLPCDNSNVQKQYEHNEANLQKMNTMLFDYLKTHVAEIDNSIQFAKINFMSHVVDDIKTQEFFKAQQETWITVFRTLPLIDTPKGRMKLEDDIKIPDIEVCDFFEDPENRYKYFDAFYEYASSVSTLPNKEICLQWAGIIHNWNLTDICQFELSLGDVAKTVTTNGCSDNLHKFLEIIREINKPKLFETLPLIPNRKGELRVSTNLRNGKNIPAELYERALPICQTEMDKLVHPDFADIISLDDYSRDQLRQAVNNANEGIKTGTIRTGKCFSPEYTYALRRFVSIYSTEQFSRSNRHQIMTSLSELKGFEYQICYIPKLDESEKDYCFNAFIFLLESELLDIAIKAKNESDWLDKNKDGLLNLISKVAQITDSDYSPRLLGSNGYPVIPNQLGDLCRLENLRIRENAISDDLADLYRSVKNEDLSKDWVDSDFCKFIPIQKTDTAKEIASTIEAVLMEEYDNEHHVSKHIIDIIQRIESKSKDAHLWKYWFKRIDEKKADLNWHIVPEESKSNFYRLMKVANNKELLQDLAEMSENTTILQQFKEFLRKHQQEQAEFKFKHQLGVYIEKLIRDKLTKDLAERINVATTIEDRQVGQDIVIQLDKKDIFFIECKAKWSFTDPAHMSKCQIQKALDETGHYALCAVDLTNFDGLSEGAYPSIDQLNGHIHIHLDIAEKLKGVAAHLSAIDQDIDENRMTISADYRSNIPKSVFINNNGFDCLIDAIVNRIKQIKNMI